MIQITPQMRIMVAVEPADFRKGIDGLARVCKDVLRHDPFGGWVFVFRNRPATALKVSGVRRPRFLAVPQAVFQRQVPLVADQQDCGGQNAGGPSVAGASLGGQSRSDASRAGMAVGRAGGLTRCDLRRIALAFSRDPWYCFHPCAK